MIEVVFEPLYWQPDLLISRMIEVTPVRERESVELLFHGSESVDYPPEIGVRLDEKPGIFFQR